MKSLHIILSAAVIFILVTPAKVLASAPLDISIFHQYATDAKSSIDYGPVDLLLNASVLDMGQSQRISAKRKNATTGTRLKQSTNRDSANEGNRFAYELFSSQEQLNNLAKVKNYLEAIPEKVDLSAYNKEENIAFWLNLYNVSMINEITQFYPKRSLKSVFMESPSLWDKKVTNVRGIDLSFNDIQWRILKPLSQSEPIVLYGLYQGIVGGPDIRKEAFSGKKLYEQLEDNAQRFVNSNRGSKKSSSNGVVRVAEFYAINKSFYNDFEHSIIAHIANYADADLSAYLSTVEHVTADISDWTINDLFGTAREFGGGSTVTVNNANMEYVGNKTTLGGVSKTQLIKLRELMRTRAKNLGGTSVTVTDLPEETNN